MWPHGPEIPSTIGDSVDFVGHVFCCQVSWKYEKIGVGWGLTHSKKFQVISFKYWFIWSFDQIVVSTENHRGMLKQGYWQSHDSGCWVQQAWLWHSRSIEFLYLWSRLVFRRRETQNIRVNVEWKESLYTVSENLNLSLLPFLGVKGFGQIRRHSVVTPDNVVRNRSWLRRSYGTLGYRTAVHPRSTACKAYAQLLHHRSSPRIYSFLYFEYKILIIGSYKIPNV